VRTTRIESLKAETIAFHFSGRRLICSTPTRLPLMIRLAIVSATERLPAQYVRALWLITITLSPLRSNMNSRPSGAVTRSAPVGVVVGARQGIAADQRVLEDHGVSAAAG
jgi:hypothetical protein